MKDQEEWGMMNIDFDMKVLKLKQWDLEKGQTDNVIP